MKKLNFFMMFFLLLLVGHQQSFGQVSRAPSTTGQAEFIEHLLNQSCPSDIPIVEQLPRGLFTKGKLCLAYDLSGNYIGLKNCDAPLSSRSFAMDQFEADSDEEPTRELTLEEMKDFIKVYPNPTDGIFNVVFEEEIHGKIYKVEVFNPNGGLIRSKDLLPGESSTTFNISGYPVGIYILKFTLYTSDFININLIKK